MIETLMSAFIDSDGDVVATTSVACYQFKQKLKEPQKLLDRLTKTQEINTEHWEVVWKREGVDLSQDKSKK